MRETKEVRNIDQCIECDYEFGFLVEGTTYHLCVPCADMIETGNYDDGKREEVRSYYFSMDKGNRKKLVDLNETIRRKKE